MTDRKIINARIMDDGKTIEIETNIDDDYHFIWLQATDLPDIADMAEKL